MTISISNLTVSSNAPAGTTVGVLTATDGAGNIIPCNFILTKKASGYFGVSSDDLITEWSGSIAPGYYPVRVRANGINTRFSGSATFTINVAAASPPPAPPPAPPPPPPSPTSVGFTTSEILTAAVRNDYTGFIGVQITTGTKYLSVSSLGRFVLSGNTQAHLVKIVDVSTGLDVGSVTVNTSGAPAGKFVYAALSSPVALVPGIPYYIVSQETSGGDSWYDSNTRVTTTLDASAIGWVSGGLTTPSENWSLGTTANQEFGPVDFLYSYRPQPTLLTGFTPITDPSQITGPGNYQLVNDVSIIQIDTSNVVVDGGGFQATNLLGVGSGADTITNVTIRNLRSRGAVLFSDSNATRNATPAITLTNSTITSSSGAYVAQLYGNNIVMSNCIVVGTVSGTDDGMILGSYTNSSPNQFVTISNNIFTRCYDAGIEGLGAGWQNITFTGNTFRNSPICIGMWYSLNFGTTVAPTNCVFKNNAADATVGRLFQFRNGGLLSTANDDATANRNWPGNTFSGNTHTT